MLELLIRDTSLTEVIVKNGRMRSSKLYGDLKKQNIKIYKLSSFYNDEEISGEYYSAELQAVDKSDESLWVVEKVLKKRKRRGKTEFLCKFQGWPDKYNQYIPEEDIQTLS